MNYNEAEIRAVFPEYDQLNNGQRGRASDTGNELNPRDERHMIFAVRSISVDSTWHGWGQRSAVVGS